MAYPEDWQERVKPFLEHVEFLVPIEEERERFLQWLAHIVQVPEVLPHTTRAVAEFKEDCKTELTSRDAIKSHVSRTLNKDGRLPANVNDMHLTHAIRRARMLNTGRRIDGLTRPTSTP